MVHWLSLIRLEAGADTFQIIHKINQTKSHTYVIDKSNIADGVADGESVTNKYKYPNQSVEESNKTQWIDVEMNQDFQVWMKIAGFPIFRKLYGKINERIEVGNKVLIFNDSKSSLI